MYMYIESNWEKEAEINKLEIKKNEGKLRDLVKTARKKRIKERKWSDINVLHTKYDCGSSVHSLVLCVKRVCTW